MRTRSVVIATTLTVGLVAGVGSSALAIAFVPGDSSGVTTGVQAIASPTQDPAEGSIAWFIDGTPVKVTVPGPFAVDDGGDEPDTEVAPVAEVDPAAEPAPSPSASSSGAVNGNAGNGNSGSGNGNSGNGNGNSGQSAEDKAKEDKAKKDKKAAEDKAKKDKENQSDE